MSVLGSTRTVRARKQHPCFLCSIPIAVGSEHLTWAWRDEDTRSVATLRVHQACRDYAHDHIDGWTNGDGCDENAVETDLDEALIRWAPDGRGRILGVDEKERDVTLATWPALAPLVAKVCADIQDRAAEDRSP